MNKINNAVDELDDMLTQYYQERFKGVCEIPYERKESMLHHIRCYEDRQTCLKNRACTMAKVSFTVLFLGFCLFMLVNQLGL